MASQTESPAAPAAQMVGNAFVEQYYRVLHKSPEWVHRFYQDSSMLSRPEPNGTMTSVTKMQAINEKILSVDYKNYMAEIKTVDAQASHEGGVIVLVTGCLTGPDRLRSKFTQSFFLAPQDNGYFVLNDIFRYVDENEPTEINPTLVNGTSENVPPAPLTPEPEPSEVSDWQQVPEPTTSPSEEETNNGGEVCNPSENEGSVVEEDGVDSGANLNQKEVQSAAESTSVVQEDAPKKSYASIVKVMKDSAASLAVKVPTTTVKVAPRNVERQPLSSSASGSAPEAPAPSSNGAPGNNNSQEEVEGHSIYIGGLPPNAMVSQLEEEFKKFGPIKSDGIQVRSSKPHGFCFGFIEFELASSMHKAIEESPIMIGGRQAFIQEKKTTSRVRPASPGGSGGRGRFLSGRGNFRNDSFRGRGYFGGRGYGRSEYGSRGEYSGHSRGSARNSEEGFQRFDQNGNGRGGRSGVVAQRAIPA